MTHDICDGTVTFSSQDSLTHWNDLVRAFMAHSATAPNHLGAVLQAEPDFAMGWAAKGLFSLMMGRKELISVAQDAHRSAVAANAGSHRERQWVLALSEWLAGRPSGAIAAMESALKDNPRDTLSAKISHAIRFILGDGEGMRASVENILGAHDANHPLRGYLLGCHAFTLEEAGEYARAEATGLEGLQTATDDAWGLHAVAHVYDCLLYTSPSPRDLSTSRMPSSA